MEGSPVNRQMVRWGRAGPERPYFSEASRSVSVGHTLSWEPAGAQGAEPPLPNMLLASCVAQPTLNTVSMPFAVEKLPDLTVHAGSVNHSHATL